MSPMYVDNPAPGEEICDFCSSPDVQWVFPCRDHQSKAHIDALVIRSDLSATVTGADMDGTFVGDWAACPACHALILRGDRVRLARRSTKRLVAKYAKQNVFMGFKDVLAHIRSRHDQFWTNRQGPPFPASESSRIRRGRTP